MTLYSAASAFKAPLEREQRLLSGRHCSTSSIARTTPNLSVQNLRPSGGFLTTKPEIFFHDRHTRSGSLIARMGIKWIESFQSKVDIPEERKEQLERLLGNSTFCDQVKFSSGISWFG